MAANTPAQSQKRLAHHEIEAGFEPGHGLTTTMTVISMIGTFTALFAATIAVSQNDVKRLVAYSTISQLGYMVAAVGIGAFVGQLST